MMPGWRIAGQWGAQRRLRIVAIAGVIVLAAAAGLTALGAHFALTTPTPRAALVDWQADDGTTFRVALNAVRFDRFLEQRAIALDQERQRLSAIAAASIGREVADVYGGMTARIPQYTDWVYGWIDNYITTYLVIGRAVELVASPAEGAARPDVATAFRRGMHEVIGEHFASIVIAPANSRAAMTASLGRLEALLAAEWRHVIAADRMAWDAFLLREGLTVPARGERAVDDRCEIRAPTPDADQADLVQAERLDGQQSDLFAVRLARPPAFFVFRVGLGPLLSTGSVVTVAALANPTAALTLAATTASLWSLDFVLNQIDGYLHRATFESRLTAAIDALRRGDAETLTTRVDGALAAAFAALASCRNPLVTAQQ